MIFSLRYLSASSVEFISLKGGKARRLRVDTQPMIATWLDPSLDLARSELAEFDWVEEIRPEEFKNLKLEDSKGTFLLTSQGWLEAGRRLNLRFTRLQAAAVDILTVMCYPTNRPDLLPVYAYEWVMINGRGHAMICDVEICGDYPELESRLQKLYAPSANEFSGLFEYKEPPEWFQEIAQPHAQFFSSSLQDMEQIFRLQTAYLRCAVENFYRPVLASGVTGGTDHADVLNYKTHHADHSPGTKMLGRFLGAERAHQFLYQYHFGPAR